MIWNKKFLVIGNEYLPNFEGLILLMRLYSRRKICDKDKKEDCSITAKRKR